MNQIMKVFENQHFKIDEGLFLPVRNIGSCVCHRPAVRKGGKPAVRKQFECQLGGYTGGIFKSEQFRSGV
jgi:hypothetical protein